MPQTVQIPNVPHLWPFFLISLNLLPIPPPNTITPEHHITNSIPFFSKRMPPKEIKKRTPLTRCRCHFTTKGTIKWQCFLHGSFEAKGTQRNYQRNRKELLLWKRNHFLSVQKGTERNCYCGYCGYCCFALFWLRTFIVSQIHRPIT